MDTPKFKHELRDNVFFLCNNRITEGKILARHIVETIEDGQPQSSMHGNLKFGNSRVEYQIGGHIYQEKFLYKSRQELIENL